MARDRRPWGTRSDLPQAECRQDVSGADSSDSDEFNGNRLGLQWQWHANPQPAWAFPAPGLGFLRLYAIPPPGGYRNLWDVPDLLLQKFPAPEFTVTAKVTFTPRVDQDRAGLIVMGADYAYLGIRKKPGGLFLSQTVAQDADRGSSEKELGEAPVTGDRFYLRVQVSQGASCQFSYSLDGTHFMPIGEPFSARAGRWIGAKVGLFALGTVPAPEFGYADFDWFHVE